MHEARGREWCGRSSRGAPRRVGAVPDSATGTRRSRRPAAAPASPPSAGRSKYSVSLALMPMATVPHPMLYPRLLAQVGENAGHVAGQHVGRVDEAQRRLPVALPSASAQALAACAQSSAAAWATLKAGIGRESFMLSFIPSAIIAQPDDAPKPSRRLPSRVFDQAFDIGQDALDDDGDAGRGGMEAVRLVEGTSAATPSRKNG